MFLKTDKAKATPLLLKIGIVVIGWSYLSGLVSHIDLGHRAAMHAFPLRWAFGVAINLVGLALAVALWNMKRWAALGLLVVTVFFLVLKVGAATHPALIVAIRLLPLAPAAIYWKQLTWT